MIMYSSRPGSCRWWSSLHRPPLIAVAHRTGWASVDYDDCCLAGILNNNSLNGVWRQKQKYKLEFISSSHKHMDTESCKCGTENSKLSGLRCPPNWTGRAAGYSINLLIKYVGDQEEESPISTKCAFREIRHRGRGWIQLDNWSGYQIPEIDIRVRRYFNFTQTQ